MHGTCIKMIAEVKNVWSCTSTLPCDFVFMAWRLIHCMDELSRFYLYIHALLLNIANLCMNMSFGLLETNDSECYGSG